jgi:hypothetical protein
MWWECHVCISDDGIGEACKYDFDNDTVPNYLDNCPNNSKIFSTDFRFVLLVHSTDLPLHLVRNVASSEIPHSLWKLWVHDHIHDSCQYLFVCFIGHTKRLCWILKEILRLILTGLYTTRELKSFKRWIVTQDLPLVSIMNRKSFKDSHYACCRTVPEWYSHLAMTAFFFVIHQSSYHVTLYSVHTDVIIADDGRSYLHNRPWRPIGLWDVEDPTMSGQSAHKWQ